MEPLIIALALSSVNYYVTTFSIWFGHWFSHLNWSPFRGFHVLGHHRLYPTSRHLLSDRFRYGSGRHDSIWALVPWLLLQAIVALVALPAWLFLVCLFEIVSITIVTSYIHMQFHLRDSKLARFKRFLNARRVHALHHDLDKNFMVADHFWDRCFGTYSDEGMQMADASVPGAGRPGV